MKSQKTLGFTQYTEIVGKFFLVWEKEEIVTLYIKKT